MMEFRTIPLTQGQVAIVDAEDYERISEFKWHAWKEPHSGNFYAVRNILLPNGKRGVSLMHREIMCAPVGFDVDHREGVTLDNRKGISLRISTHSQNLCNQKRSSRNTSGYKGVSLYKRNGKWAAYINVRKQRTFLGYFASAEDAFERRKEAANDIHGEFAKNV